MKTYYNRLCKLRELYKQIEQPEKRNRQDYLNEQYLKRINTRIAKLQQSKPDYKKLERYEPLKMLRSYSSSLIKSSN